MKKRKDRYRKHRRRKQRPENNCYWIGDPFDYTAVLEGLRKAVAKSGSIKGQKVKFFHNGIWYEYEV